MLINVFEQNKNLIKYIIYTLRKKKKILFTDMSAATSGARKMYRTHA